MSHQRDSAIPADGSWRRWRVQPARIIGDILLLAAGAALSLPLLWLALTSLDGAAGWSLKWPALTLSNYEGILSGASGLGLQPFLNSLYLATTATVVTTILATLAAYPLSRQRIPLKRPVLLAALFLSALPAAMVIVPLYELYSFLGWLDSIPYTALFLAASSLPFAVWLIKSFIDSVPLEFEHAASLEGAGRIRILGGVVLPLILPGLSVSAIYTFLQAWSAFLIPLVLDTNPADQPAPTVLYDFMSVHSEFPFGAICAFSILYSLPVVILYLVLSRHFSGAFNFAGGLRG